MVRFALCSRSTSGPWAPISGSSTCYTKKRSDSRSSVQIRSILSLRENVLFFWWQIIKILDTFWSRCNNQQITMMSPVITDSKDIYHAGVKIYSCTQADGYLLSVWFTCINMYVVRLGHCVNTYDVCLCCKYLFNLTSCLLFELNKEWHYNSPICVVLHQFHDECLHPK